MINEKNTQALINEFIVRLRGAIQAQVEEAISRVLGNGGGAAKAPRRFTLTPKAARARRLQGEYLGALRALRGRNRALVKKAAREQGVPAAVELARSLKAA